jgi:hypothetical protein
MTQWSVDFLLKDRADLLAEEEATATTTNPTPAPIPDVNAFNPLNLLETLPENP